MNPIDEELLESMLDELESDRVERKQSFKGNAPETVREAICAFANDLAGHGEPGVVFVGVRDDGESMNNFNVTDELLRQLADIKTDGNIAPPPTLLVEKRYLRGHEVAVITVWPCDTPPVRYRGRIHVRWGPRRGLASAQDERILNERRRHRDRPFDVQPVMEAVLDEYEATNAPVRVYWFDDRIEIHNPGGPFGCVTPENFGQPGITGYRNPNLAEALRALGYVQRFGAGIAIARKALGDRLGFEVQPGFVAVVIQGEAA